MIIKHKTKRRYVHGGSGIFDIIGKIASKVATKAPEVLAKAQANKLINQLTKKALSAGQKALIDNTDRLVTGAVNKIIDKSKTQKIVDKDVIAKQQVRALINNLTSQPTTDQNLSSLISGMGLRPIRPIRGNGIVLD